MTKYLIYFMCSAILSTACGHRENCEHDHDDNKHDQTKTPNEHELDEHDHADEIIFTPQQAKNAGIELFTVKTGNFNHIIKTSGQILPAQGDEVSVVATTSGRISFAKSAIAEGVAIKTGEILLNISSKNMGEGDPIEKTRLAFELAQSEYLRAESLIVDKLISQKEYQEAKINFETSKLAYQAFSENKSSKGVGIKSPINGYIKSSLVNEGDFVEIGQGLFTVAQNKRLQLRAEVSERYYKELPSIHSANFKTPYEKNVYKLSELNGKLLSYGRASNGQEYYVPINFDFDNVGQIISGSFVEVYLLSKTLENVIAIPKSSLIEDQGLFFVFVQIDEEGYLKQEVHLGNDNGEEVEIRSGIKQGDKIVSKGTYHIKLAASSSEIPHGHTH